MHPMHHSPLGAALHSPRPRPAPRQTPLAAWRALWRCAPQDLRRDTLALMALIPAALAIFASAWAMLP